MHRIIGLNVAALRKGPISEPLLGYLQKSAQESLAIWLPSHAEFETLFGFAKEFYEVVSHSIIESGPAVIPRMVGHGFVRLMGSLGAQNPRFDSDDDQ